MLSTDELSRTTAQVAIRVLAGESPGSIKTPVQRTGQPTYDARELRRWNIDDRRLPAGSVVLFREATMWERNRGPIAVGALLVGIPVVAIVLFVGVMRQRRDLGRLSDATPVLTPSPADATVRMWTVGPDGQRVEVGQAPAAGRHRSWTSLVHPEDVEQCGETFSRALERREPFQMEYRIREANGAERWMLDTGLVRFSGEAFDGYVGSTVDITTLARARAELSNLSRYLIQEHERERAALAKTLHDDVGQRMVALTLRLHSLQGAAHDAEVAQIRETLSSLVADIATASDPVYVRLEHLGLATAARGLCEELSARYDVAIHFRDEDVPSDLPFDIALALFRVLQEATVNAAVHSQAREVWVWVRGAAAEVRLQVVDCGVGFDAQSTGPAAGVGLVAIRERLKLVGGDSLIVSGRSEGTRVEAWVPLRPPERTAAV
jgi:signal transduction histidine kinase